MPNNGKMTINLLPPEELIGRKQSLKLSLLNKVSIGLLVSMVFLSSATIALRISQNQQFKATNDNLVHAETQVTALQSRAVQVESLKKRLGTVGTLEGKDAKIKSIFNLVVSLTPGDVQISDASVDNNGRMSISAITQSLPSFNALLTNLKDKGRTSNLIAKVSLDSLSIGRDSTYRFGLKIEQK